MNTITVDKTRLLGTLSQNRNDHRELFLEAQKVFREKVIETLDERLAIARNGGKVELWIRLPQPEDYTEEFDKAIAMVQWAQGDTIDLTEKDFTRYVLNKWEWDNSFVANTMSYVGGGDEDG